MFTGNNLDSFTNFRIVEGTGTVVAVATTSNSGEVSFTNLSTSTTTIARDATVTYKLIADANTNIN